MPNVGFIVDTLDAAIVCAKFVYRMNLNTSMGDIMISQFPKKHFYLITLLVSVLLLSSCITEEDSCKDTVITAGEPDLTTTVGFSVATLTQADTTVVVNVPVDGETLEGTVYLLPVGSQNVADQVATVPFVTVNAGVAETVPVTLPLATPPLGTYYPVVVLCDPSVASCTTGAGYVGDISGLLADTGNYVRGTANGGSVDLSSLADSCVLISTVDVI